MFLDIHEINVLFMASKTQTSLKSANAFILFL